MGACCGLPLSLEVMGRFLNGENFIPVWRDAFTQLQNAQSLQEDDMLKRTLRISIDDLEPLKEKCFLMLLCSSLTLLEKKKEQRSKLRCRYGSVTCVRHLILSSKD